MLLRPEGLSLQLLPRQCQLCFDQRALWWPTSGVSPRCLSTLPLVSPSEVMRKELEGARREAIRAKRRRKRQQKRAAKAAVASDMDTTALTDTTQAGAAGNAAPSAGEVTTPRRSTAPNSFEKGHTGLTPPCKRHCGDPPEAAGDVEVHHRLSELSVVSGASDWTVYTHLEGGTERPAGRSSQCGWADFDNKDDKQLPAGSADMLGGPRCGTLFWGQRAASQAWGEGYRPTEIIIITMLLKAIFVCA